MRSPSTTSPSPLSVSMQSQSQSQPQLQLQHHPLTPLKSSKSLEGFGFDQFVPPSNDLAGHSSSSTPTSTSTSTSFDPYSHHAHSHSQSLSPPYPLPLFYQRPSRRSEWTSDKSLQPEPLAVGSRCTVLGSESPSTSARASTISIQIQLQQDYDDTTASAASAADSNTGMSQLRPCSPTTTTTKDSASTIDNYYSSTSTREGFHEEPCGSDRRSYQSPGSDSAGVFASVDIGIERPPEELSHQHQQQFQQPQPQEKNRITTIDEWNPSPDGETLVVHPPVTQDSDDDDEDDDDDDEVEEEEEEEKAESDFALKAFVSETIYGRQSHYKPPTRQIPNKLVDTSQYFRDKKWDFFPELASPTGLQLANTASASKSRKVPGANRYKRKTTGLYRDTFKGKVLEVRNSFRLFGSNRRVSKEAAGLGSTSTSAEPSPLSSRENNNESGYGNLDVNEDGEFDLIKRPSSPIVTSPTTTTKLTPTLLPEEETDAVVTDSLPALRYEPRPSTFYDACFDSDEESGRISEEKYEYEHGHQHSDAVVDIDGDHNEEDEEDGHEISIYIQNTEDAEPTTTDISKPEPDLNLNEQKETEDEENAENAKEEAEEAALDFDPQLTSQVRPHTSTTKPSTSTPQHQAQLAIPLSSYQKYGPAIWNTPKSKISSHNKKRHHRVRHHHRKSSSASSQSRSSTTESYSTKASSVYPNTTSPTKTDTYVDNGTGYLNPNLALTPPPKSPLRARSTATNTNTNTNPNPNKEEDRGTVTSGRKASQMLGDAKKIITDSKTDRRREELKAQIKFVGPLNPQSFEERYQWI